MPCYGYGNSNGNTLQRLVEQQVAAKFPDLPRDSSGWWRAVENRYRRLAKSF